MAPDFWDDPKKAEKILAEISSKKKWTDGFNQTNNAVEDAAVMFEFFQSG
ncbi:MAG: peptide chain release factor 2, partial [Pedobacter sp.]